MSLSQLETQINYHFSDKSLLRKALIHRSFSSDSNERLEFLGDSVLSGVIATHLYQNYPHFNEGQLSRLRASLVNGMALSKIAQSIDLGSYLVLGKGEDKAQGREKVSVLEDALEALIGAVFLDSNWDKAEIVVKGIFSTMLDNLNFDTIRNYKTELQEQMQKKSKSLPSYTIESVSGAEHSQTFVVVCKVQGVNRAMKGLGSSRKKAEQEAASHMLEWLKKLDNGEL
jgi:ribonuclease III